MKLLGLDFDNTLVRYDKLFHQLAIEKDLIDKSLPANKTAIRNYLRSQGRDEDFTLLQGEVYGLRILEAEPAPGMLQALRELHHHGVQMVLISHKTRTPYKGPAYDLRGAAINWLEKHGFFDYNSFSWRKDQVYFEETKSDKLKRIISSSCSHYIDDLVEVLRDLPDKSSIKRIMYSPNEIPSDVEVANNITIMKDWNLLTQLVPELWH